MKVHTPEQVAVGAVIGIGVAVVWNLFVHCVIRPRAFDILQRSHLGRRLLIRDCSHVGCITRFEYDAVMNAPNSAFTRLHHCSKTE